MKKKLLACALAALSFAAHAQSFPTKPLRMIVHFPPGGPTDLVARILAQKMSETWGQQVIVENRPGAGGVIGVELVVRAQPDGYTLLFATGGSMSITPALGRKLPYDVFRDVQPISLVVINPQILVLHPSLPANSVRELIKLAKSKPGQLNYASVGPGSPQHLGMELFKSLTGTDMVHIPYKGTAPAVTDLLAGQVSFMFNSMPSVLPHVKAGRLKGIAVSTATRSPAVPDVPTVAEAGVPGFDYATWYGLFAPAGTPKEVIAQINAETNRILNDRDIAQRLINDGADPKPGTPEALAKYMKSEYEQWKKTIAAAGLKLD